MMEGKRLQEKDVAGRNVGFSEPKRQFRQLERLYSDPKWKRKRPTEHRNVRLKGQLTFTL